MRFGSGEVGFGLAARRTPREHLPDSRIAVLQVAVTRAVHDRGVRRVVGAGQGDVGAVALLAHDVAVGLGETQTGPPEVDHGREDVRRAGGARARRAVLAHRRVRLVAGVAGSGAGGDARRAEDRAADRDEGAARGVAEPLARGVPGVVDRAVEDRARRDLGQRPGRHDAAPGCRQDVHLDGRRRRREGAVVHRERERVDGPCSSGGRVVHVRGAPAAAVTRGRSDRRQCPARRRGRDREGERLDVVVLPGELDGDAGPDEHGLEAVVGIRWRRGRRRRSSDDCSSRDRGEYHQQPDEPRDRCVHVESPNFRRHPPNGVRGQDGHAR